MPFIIASLTIGVIVELSPRGGMRGSLLPDLSADLRSVALIGGCPVRRSYSVAARE